MTLQLQEGGRAFSSTLSIARDPILAEMLGGPISFFQGSTTASANDVFVGWGRKVNTQKVRRAAEENGLPYWSLEDGFVGYLGHPVYGGPQLSIIVDDTGIHYNAGTPSRLERLVIARAKTSTFGEDQQRGSDLIRRIRGIGASKYNLQGRNLKAQEREVKSVLVIDQTAGDSSIVGGLASPSDFQTMLLAALSENPGKSVVIKTHPDVIAGIKQSCFGDWRSYVSQNDIDRVSVLATDQNIYDFFDTVSRVYCVTSQLGFEALIAGKEVAVFGWPFFAGWGLTDDRAEPDPGIQQRRNVKPSLEQFVLAALVDSSIYYDPYEGKRSSLDRVLDILEAELSVVRPTPNLPLNPVGFSLWKRSFISCFTAPWARNTKRKKSKGTRNGLLIWGNNAAPTKYEKDTPIWRMEDGFIRSVGLGSDLKRPASLVLDNVGIYYDATGPSALEDWLTNSELSPEARTRASILRKTIIESRVTKYNVGRSADLDFKNRSNGRPVILVPGQVETDASLRYGSPTLKTNQALLSAVRTANPDSYLVYKPHPDVLAGNRDQTLKQAVDDADEIVTDADILECFEAVDSVHTMTSLSGFEALMRGMPITCYGMPFYAGWGLTTDIETSNRRGRKLDLDHLVYGALIAYPRYFSWEKRRAVGPEQILDEIARHKTSVQMPISSPNWITKQAKKIYFLLEALLRY